MVSVEVLELIFNHDVSFGSESVVTLVTEVFKASETFSFEVQSVVQVCGSVEDSIEVTNPKVRRWKRLARSKNTGSEGEDSSVSVKLALMQMAPQKAPGPYGTWLRALSPVRIRKQSTGRQYFSSQSDDGVKVNKDSEGHGSKVAGLKQRAGEEKGRVGFTTQRRTLPKSFKTLTFVAAEQEQVEGKGEEIESILSVKLALMQMAPQKAPGPYGTWLHALSPVNKDSEGHGSKVAGLKQRAGEEKGRVGSTTQRRTLPKSFKTLTVVAVEQEQALPAEVVSNDIISHLDPIELLNSHVANAGSASLGTLHASDTMQRSSLPSRTVRWKRIAREVKSRIAGPVRTAWKGKRAVDGEAVNDLVQQQFHPHRFKFEQYWLKDEESDAIVARCWEKHCPGDAMHGVGNVLNICAVQDKWLSRPFLFKVMAPSSLPSNTLVSELQAAYGVQDRLIWYYGNDSFFSVKSGYWLAEELGASRLLEFGIATILVEVLLEASGSSQGEAFLLACMPSRFTLSCRTDC
ncbi:hypothetical protein JRO89_XS01G0152100 [Xanthoceras sorbifolium]|uniref:Uncharacterized protein n=1 Tax=Xanthoceras sorbifolium TaxID=99658 RepID=A0ABQ8IJF4_9ROSI|nr:hypothetical protein JRO89_XS01G0152100 [Xanthoceras sorbifolium]